MAAYAVTKFVKGEANDTTHVVGQKYTPVCGDITGGSVTCELALCSLFCSPTLDAGSVSVFVFSLS